LLLVTAMSRTDWWMPTRRRWRLSPHIFGTFWLRGARSPRSGLMEWICFAGSGFSGPPGWPGIGRRGWRPRFQQMATDHWQTAGAALASANEGRHDRRCVALAGRGVCAVGACAFRDGAARLLRLSPGGRDRADPQPVPARSISARWPRTRAPQSDGALPQRAQRACIGRRYRPGSRAVCRMSSSTRSSRGCRRTGTGRLSLSMCRPGRGQCHLAYVDHASAVVNLAIVMVAGCSWRTPVSVGVLMG